VQSELPHSLSQFFLPLAVTEIFAKMQGSSKQKSLVDTRPAANDQKQFAINA